MFPTYNHQIVYLSLSLPNWSIAFIYVSTMWSGCDGVTDWYVPRSWANTFSSTIFPFTVSHLSFPNPIFFTDALFFHIFFHLNFSEVVEFFWKNFEIFRKKIENNSHRFLKHFDSNFVKLSGKFWNNFGDMAEKTWSSDFKKTVERLRENFGINFEKTLGILKKFRVS